MLLGLIERVFHDLAQHRFLLLREVCISIVVEFMSQLHMSIQVLTHVVGVAPGHYSADRTHSGCPSMLGFEVLEQSCAVHVAVRTQRTVESGAIDCGGGLVDFGALH